NILVLSKHKTVNTTQFIDASGEGFFKKASNTNVLTDKHIGRIMEMFDSKENVPHISRSVDNILIAENDYNLSVTSYVEAEDTREKIDIVELNKEISETVQKIDSLREDVDLIVKEIEA